MRGCTTAETSSTGLNGTASFAAQHPLRSTASSSSVLHQWFMREYQAASSSHISQQLKWKQTAASRSQGGLRVACSKEAITWHQQLPFSSPSSSPIYKTLHPLMQPTDVPGNDLPALIPNRTASISTIIITNIAMKRRWPATESLLTLSWQFYALTQLPH